MLDIAHDGADNRKSGTQAISRALDVLDLLAMGSNPNRGLKIGDISKFLGITRPTTHRILTTLIERGFAQRVEKSGRYMIGEQISLLALSRERKLPILQLAETHLQDISRIVDDTVFFSIRSGRDVLTIARMIGNFPIQVLSIDVGDRRPLGAITAGVAMLSRLSDDEASGIVANDEARLAKFQYTVPDVLNFVRETRARGFAYRQKGVIPGTKAIAVTVGRPGDPVMGAVTVSGMAKRMTESRVNEIIGAVSSECEAMATKLRQKLTTDGLMTP
jgi:DNA-binding IclR family transcriptional regulator